MNCEVDGLVFYIALATYNGERFLPELLSSIQSQSFREWKLLSRDDGSTDDTQLILKERSDRDGRIEVLDETGGQLGASLNFGCVMQAALAGGARYLAFADQDDVWAHEKLARQLHLIQDAENEFGSDTPILVHSDLSVVNERLETLQSSFMKSSRRFRNEGDPLRTLLAHNFVIGCSVVINQSLLELATPVPAGAFMHDWWLALCSAAAGRIVYSDETLVKYRQHDHNSIGAGRSSYTRALWELIRQDRWRKDLQAHCKTIAQAHAVRNRIAERYPDDSIPSALDQFCEATGEASSSLSRALHFVRRRTLQLPLARKAVFLMRTVAANPYRRAA